MGLAVVDRAHRLAGKRHVAGGCGLGDGQLAGGLGHLVVGSNILVFGFDHNVACEGAFVFAGVGALSAIGQTLPGLPVEQAAAVALALGGDAGDLLLVFVVGLGIGLAGKRNGALGDGQILGGVDVAFVVAGDGGANVDRGRGHRGGGDFFGVRGPGTVGLLILDHHRVAVVAGHSCGARGMGFAVVNSIHRGAGERNMLGNGRLFHMDSIGFGSILVPAPESAYNLGRSWLNARNVRPDSPVTVIRSNGCRTCIGTRPLIAITDRGGPEKVRFVNFNRVLPAGSGRGPTADRVYLVLATKDACRLLLAALNAFVLSGKARGFFVGSLRGSGGFPFIARGRTGAAVGIANFAAGVASGRFGLIPPIFGISGNRGNRRPAEAEHCYGQGNGD